MRQQNELDKYYTKGHVARQCVRMLDTTGYDLIIEPAAGGGSFLKHLRGNVVALDVSPEGAGIIRQSWADHTIPPCYKNVLVIGNPPFGMRHAKSDLFIRHALQFGNVRTIAFILPNTYRKHTRQRILPARGWRIKSITPLEDGAFTLHGRERHIPCSFFVFDRSPGEDLRVDISKHTDTKHFVFGNKHCFDLFVFGAAPQRVIYDPTSNNRGHFLKAKAGYSRGFIKRNIEGIDWRGNSCANGGVFWLTKYELLAQYNNTIQ